MFYYHKSIVTAAAHCLKRHARTIRLRKQLFHISKLSAPLVLRQVSGRQRSTLQYWKCLVNQICIFGRKDVDSKIVFMNKPDSIKN